ncbi:hypothetical protein MTR67_032274 [Solanum verrucosum]|uniref:Uncharacterized protein n=1 Tax=Solanum verrucosum TaxID=315347 RepID=A0AAF0U457_SOLVR|nr:hypothetical protein MTR67_032274 [Solanum verrucosum]
MGSSLIVPGTCEGTLMAMDLATKGRTRPSMAKEVSQQGKMVEVTEQQWLTPKKKISAHQSSSKYTNKFEFLSTDQRSIQSTKRSEREKEQAQNILNCR